MNIEEFVNYYLQNYRHEVLLNPYNGLIEFAKVFQEKLMKDAVEVPIYYTHEISLPPEHPGFGKVGDKVKILIVKES